MMNLAEYRNRNARLADFLPWVALVGQGIVLNKDGSFQRTVRFRGPDLDSAVPAELVVVAGRLNNAFRRLGSGWAIFVEAQRHPSNSYPDSRFPDAASALVDAERRASFEEAGAHFESSYFLTLTYLPPAEDAARAEGWLYEGRETKGIDPHEVLAGFADRTDRVLRLVEAFMPECHWLDDAETLTYLHGCVSTKRHHVRVPETPMYLDALLADQPLAGGLEPRLGDQHLRVLTVTGFPTVTTPGLLDELNRLAFPYRWSTRDCRDPERGDDQRSVGADRHRRFQQGGGRRSRASGTGRRLCRRRLCHRDGDGVGCRPACRRREAAPRREDHPGPRLQRHARDHQRRGCLARLTARTCLRQCPPAADLHAQSRPLDPPECCVGGAGTGRAPCSAPTAVRQDRRLYPVPLFPSYRRCWSYANRRTDRRWQVGAAGTDGAAVPPLCVIASFRI